MDSIYRIPTCMQVCVCVLCDRIGHACLSSHRISMTYICSDKIESEKKRADIFFSFLIFDSRKFNWFSLIWTLITWCNIHRKFYEILILTSKIFNFPRFFFDVVKKKRGNPICMQMWIESEYSIIVRFSLFVRYMTIWSILSNSKSLEKKWLYIIIKVNITQSLTFVWKTLNSL